VKALAKVRPVLERWPDWAAAAQIQEHARMVQSMAFVPYAGDDPRGGFYMDKTEVTNAQYEEFLEARGTPEHRRPWRFPDYEDYSPDLGCPVIYVSWYEAVAYANHVGKRLPTGEEWELAFATGPEGWPSDADDLKWNTRESRYGRTGRVGLDQFDEDVTPRGIEDLGGNVSEWTTQQLANGEKRVKGGNWQYLREKDEFEKSAGDYCRYVGFRCVVDALPRNLADTADKTE
jgi:formylglycine-generating enzyme required for sulfatase activity